MNKKVTISRPNVPDVPSLADLHPHLAGVKLGETVSKTAPAGFVAPGAGKLSDIDVAFELEHAFRAAKTLLDECVTDYETPVNQKAQVIGALNTVLAAMIKQRADIYSSERVRTLESVLLKVLKRHPELATEFLADYKTELEKVA